MSDAKHGDYDPASGWYSSLTKAWHKDPSQIGTVAAPYEPTEADRQQFAQKWGKGRDAFKPRPDMERLLKFRDSDRADERAKYEAIAKGTHAMTVHSYEAARKAHTDAGGKV